MPIVTIQNFTGVYTEQPFMQGLRELAASNGDIHWLDCTKIEGTDCYCDDEAQDALNKMMDEAVATATNTSATSTPGIHFFDNGNYHYMSKLWTDRVQEPFDLVVFDHHPDMQPPRFEGILSCGGWIKEVLDHNKFVQNVIVIGVADHLVEEIREDLSQANATEILNRVTFIRESELKRHPENLSSLVCSGLASVLSSNIYLSIDKDALAPTYATTNWDQGSLTFEQLAETLQVLAEKRKILGIDICGERSRDMDLADTSTADSLNNALNEKLFHLLTGFHGVS